MHVFFMQLFTPELIQVLLALVTALVTGLASYFAAQKGVAVAVARLEEKVSNIDERQEDHSDRIKYLERATKKA